MTNSSDMTSAIWKLAGVSASLRRRPGQLGQKPFVKIVRHGDTRHGGLQAHVPLSNLFRSRETGWTVCQMITERLLFGRRQVMRPAGEHLDHLSCGVAIHGSRASSRWNARLPWISSGMRLEQMFFELSSQL